MLIIPLPWDREELTDMQELYDEFDLMMTLGVRQPHYFVIQDNTITFLGVGTIPGRAAYQIKTRSSTMNGTLEAPKLHGNVGFLGKFSGTDDAVRKIFATKGNCVSNMKLMPYSGQKLKGHDLHYTLVEPIMRLLGDNPPSDLKSFFKSFKWGSRTPFTCTGSWYSDMDLYLDGTRVSSLEVWFTKFSSIALS